MSTPLQIYRVYSFDSARKSVGADFIKAPDDEAAIAAVEAEGSGNKCEIWLGRRLVAQIDGERRQA
jgi:hypothetical protein